MKRILVFGITENPGGVESVIMNYYRKIDKDKFCFDFLCNTEKVAYEEEILKYGGTIFRITQRSKNYFQYRKDLLSFYKNNSKKYYAIWVNVCSLANIDYLKYAKKFKIKKRIIHCHNSQNMDSSVRKIIHLINRMFLDKYATDFWTCSLDSNKWFYTKKTQQKYDIVLVHNAIDLKKFKYNEDIRKKYRDEFGINASTVLYGNIGRLHFQKNQIQLINIFYYINKKNPNSKLFIIGDGEDRIKILEEISKLELQEKVCLLGVRDDVNNIINAIDCMIFPSLFEGMPLVLIESQANGICTVASDTITKNIKMSDNFHFINIAKNNKLLADEIISYNYDRVDSSKSIVYNGYDINVEIKKFEKLLEGEVNEKGQYN